MQNIFIVAKYTYRELLKSKILLNVVIVGVFLSLLAFVAVEFTFGVPERVAIDFGLGVSSVSSIIIAIFMGVGLMKNEMESRTLYMVLSKPIKRFEFLLGKFFGLQLILFLNVIIMSALTLFYYFFLGGLFSKVILYAVLFIFLEASLILLVAIFFSLISNAVLSVIFTLSFYISSYAIAEVQGMLQAKRNMFLNSAVKFLYYLLPDLTKLNIKQFVIYQQDLSAEFLTKTLSYSLIYFLILLIISSMIFEKKNLD